MSYLLCHSLTDTFFKYLPTSSFDRSQHIFMLYWEFESLAREVFLSKNKALNIREIQDHLFDIVQTPDVRLYLHTLQYQLKTFHL